MSFARPASNARYGASYRESCVDGGDRVREAIRESTSARARVGESPAWSPRGEVGELIETATRVQRENEALRGLLRRLRHESGAAIDDLGATVRDLEDDRDTLRTERDRKSVV